MEPQWRRYRKLRHEKPVSRPVQAPSRSSIQQALRKANTCPPKIFEARAFRSTHWEKSEDGPGENRTRGTITPTAEQIQNPEGETYNADKLLSCHFHNAPRDIS